jgi:hypothetical protein
VTTPPLFVLGVSRSGTTMLRVILDRSPGIAIPEESRFIPTLSRRHREPVDRDRFLDDLRRLRTLVTWDLRPSEVEPFLHDPMTLADAIGAVFTAYATKHDKPRWGDKTPMYMRHLPLLERLFGDARYVHLVRDGRDAALSLLQMPEGTFTRTWAHPKDPAGFACQWRTEVAGARAVGRSVGPSRFLEVRYEELVAEPERVVRSICDFAELPFERQMLEYAGTVDVSRKPQHRGLLRPPTTGLRDWRTGMTRADALAFEAIAGDLLGELGYELAGGSSLPSRRAALDLAWYRARSAAWNVAAAVVQRSPLWRRRHAPLYGPFTSRPRNASRRPFSEK